jgi:DNA repair protein SbcC/Rad50
MIIKRLELENIRSYEKASIELPLGNTLFEGDIGSGKSTLLMAIEFGFFGLGSETGASLLRVGESEGRVRMVFDVDGKEYEVMRSLVRKGKKIQQTSGYIRTPELVTHLSPTELKERVLEILQFNEAPDPNAQSRIYRYAIYTPQEDMKSILLLSPDLRLQTLRRAFGIESYKVAAENATELFREIRSRAREYDAGSKGLDETKERIRRLEAQSQSDKNRLQELTKRETDVAKEVEELRRRRGELQGDEVKLSAITREIAMRMDQLQRLNKDVTEWMNELDDFERGFARFEVKIAELEGLKNPTDKSESQLRKEIEVLEQRRDQLIAIEAVIDGKIEDYRTIVEKGVCPVCDRPVKDHEFAGKRNAKEVEREHASREADECARKLEASRELLEARRKHDSALEKLSDLREEAARYQSEKTARGRKISQGTKEIDQVKEKIEEGKKTRELLGDVPAKIDELNWKTKSSERELQDIREAIAATRTKADEAEKQIEEKKSEVKEKEGLARKAVTLKEHDIWLQDYFLPTLEAIERHVMVSINQDFNANLQKWFGILIDDPAKEVRVDENFTPIISQDGFEQEVHYLSGGEKTSVSLAYRLALNTLVQRVTVGMKSNLLILDEPTDGFSREQLGNVREILDEIECPQVIIVSHERELESFADQIFRIVKSQGVSRIQTSRSDQEV